MRLKVSRSKNAASLYVTKTIYEGKKQRTITVEKLGTEKELREKLNGEDPYEWSGVSTLVIEEKFYKPQKCGIFCQILLDYLLYMLYN